MKLYLPGSITLEYELVPSVVTCPIQITANNRTIEVRAAWDTGASMTSITAEVAQRLAVTPFKTAPVTSATEHREMNLYHIDTIDICSKIGLRDVVVMEASLGVDGLDALIGWDIISCGDLAISNAKRHTVLSFRVPAIGAVDFVAELMGT